MPQSRGEQIIMKNSMKKFLLVLIGLVILSACSSHEDMYEDTYLPEVAEDTHDYEPEVAEDTEDAYNYENYETVYEAEEDVHLLAIFSGPQVAAGFSHSLAIDNNGVLWQWGTNLWGGNRTQHPCAGDGKCGSCECRRLS